MELHMILKEIDHFNKQALNLISKHLGRILKKEN